MWVEARSAVVRNVSRGVVEMRAAWARESQYINKRIETILPGSAGVCRGFNSDFLGGQKSENSKIFSKVRKKSLDSLASEAICSIN